MEQIIVDDENKQRIYEHIQSSIGYYYEYKKEIEKFFSTGILDKELATRVLENLIYSCKITKFNLKLDEEFKDDRRNADEMFNQIPKGKDFHEDDELVYVRESNVEEYNNMSAGDIYSNIKRVLSIEEIYTRIYSTQNLRERANSALESIESLSEYELDVSNEHKEKLIQLENELKTLLGETKTDTNAIQNIIQIYNKEASEIWKGYLSSNAEQPRWLVHNLSRGSFEGDFNKRYMSTSLVTSRTMGLFSENIGNNFGFIINPTNIVSASEHDSFTNNSPVNEYMETFSRGKIPPIKLPWEIEETCIEQTIENSGEMLNYDNRPVYSEIVVEEFEIEAMYYRSNGEGELAPNYEMAKKMAEERGLELRELDLSKAREKQGLEPMTEGMQKSFLRNILRKNFMNEEQIGKAMHYMGYDSNTLENQFIENHYEAFYRRYLQLRNNGDYSKDDILQEFKSMVSDKEMKEMNNFYMQKKEAIIGREDYTKEDTVEIPETEENNQTGKTELWTNRFKEWNEVTDKMPQGIRGKFIKMKSDIVRSIRNFFKEKHNFIQQDTQDLDTNER